MKNLPKDSRSQEIGRLAARALGIKLPKSWIETPLAGDTDFGIDYTIQLKSNENFVNYSFYLQLKGTTVPSYSTDKNYISHDFDVSTLNNYYQQEPLVMVAVVDLSENEDNLSDCPIFYFWLEDEWFSANEEKLEKQKTISIKIPTQNILNPSLNVFNYYANRIAEKIAVAELKKKIQIPNKTVVESIELFTEAIIDKPILLKSIELKNEAPWLDNPKGAISTQLKNCSDFLSNNRIKDAKKILTDLEFKIDNFTDHELAEFYLQKGNLLSLEGLFKEAQVQFNLARQKNQKKRYYISYLESQFKLDLIPTNEELQNLINILGNDDFNECALKAKALSMLGRASDALELMKENHPSEIMIQMVICTIGQLNDELGEIIEKNKNIEFDDERKKYIFNSLSARHYFHIYSNQIGIYGEILPFLGRSSYNIEGLKISYFFIKKAWESARKLGYPSDVTTLMDISCLIYGYFNNFSDLCYHLEELLVERPNHIEIIRQYIRILFNCKEYKKVVDLTRKLKYLDADEAGIKILSYYHLGRSKQCLELIVEYETILLDNPRENTPAIFCVGVEIAEATFQKKLAEKYESIIKTLNNGEAFIAIQNFVTASNRDKSRSNEYIQDLYQTYLNLERPFVIAEQLLTYLDPHNSTTAHQLIELAEHVLSVRELSNNRYLDLAQAFFTTERWEDAEKLAEKNIAKDIAISKWKLVKAYALQNQGKVGIAYKTMEEVIKSEDIGREEQEFFISLSLSLGLIDKIVDFLEENLANSSSLQNTILIVRRLIAIYINRPEYREKLKAAILKYGELVDQNNEEQEGDYLQLCMIYTTFENDEQIKNYQERSNRYFENFPDSKILRRGNIDVENGADDLLASLKKLTGVTPELEEQWENNKQKLRSRELPVPFFMRGQFLQNTRDVYTTWMWSKCSKEEELEYKIIHSPQIEAEVFFSAIDDSDIILVEETSLLILNDLNLLDIFLEALPKFSILDSVFKRINLTTHNDIPPNSKISESILRAIHRNIEKLNLINDSGENDFNYDSALENKSGLLLTDDLYLQYLVSLVNKDILFANIFNVLEFFLYKNILNKDVVFEKIVDSFSLGIVDFYLRFDFFGKIIDYYLCKNGIDNYEDTNFKNIFDKLLAERKSYRDKQKLFLDMFSFANIENLSSNTLLSLISKLLEENSTLDPQKVINTWFIYCGLQREIKKDIGTSISKVHEVLWFKYKEVTECLNDTTYTHKILLNKIIEIILQLDEVIGKLAFNNLRASFSKDSKEYKYLESFVDNSGF
ncbi:DUF4365 domain-containing protein [Acinetobacter pittii]|uniref:DUF4365 domain-containing protein n=1 Tax=Acinetobacter pittii TaxID=48296 RepID=UPI00355B2533